MAISFFEKKINIFINIFINREIVVRNVCYVTHSLCNNKIDTQLMPQLNVLQNEVGQTVLEMAKAQKEYNVDEALAHDARVKSEELTQK